MEFRTETIKEFNQVRDTTLTPFMTFTQAVEDIESANNNYFYVSMNKEDVIEAYKNQEEVAKQLDLEWVYIEELGIYITLQP